MFIIADTSVSSVSIQSPPSYNIGDNVILLCNITLSHPIGPDISSLVVKWNSTCINGPESHTESTTEVTSSMFKSRLTLTDVTIRDAGVYNCTASISESNSEPIMDFVELCIQGNYFLYYKYIVSF